VEYASPQRNLLRVSRGTHSTGHRVAASSTGRIDGIYRLRRFQWFDREPAVHSFKSFDLDAGHLSFDRETKPRLPAHRSPRAKEGGSTFQVDSSQTDPVGAASSRDYRMEQDNFRTSAFSKSHPVKSSKSVMEAVKAMQHPAGLKIQATQSQSSHHIRRPPCLSKMPQRGAPWNAKHIQPGLILSDSPYVCWRGWMGSFSPQRRWGIILHHSGRG